MVRTPTRFIFKKQFEMHSYRWEFLRRNKEYQNDYKNFIKKTKKLSVDQRCKSQECKKFEEKYGFYPTNYNLSYQDICAIGRGQAVDGKKLTKWQEEEIRAFHQSCRMVGFVAEEVECSNDSLDQFFLKVNEMKFKEIPWPGTKAGRKELSQVESLKLVINLLYPEETIHYYLGHMIKHYQSFIKKKRFDYLRFDEYLRIYDLKTHGKTFAAIVYVMFPGHPERSYNSLLERVKRGYKRATELVSGQWQHIR